mmetsp:Transcript_8925/g.11138  ORF Transcript_8925/g.11138 Transcript_8925/m.11138 type:complete len:99 (+) Transcript_8925:506-802(+)
MCNPPLKSRCDSIRGQVMEMSASRCGCSPLGLGFGTGGAGGGGTGGIFGGTVFGTGGACLGRNTRPGGRLAGSGCGSFSAVGCGEASGDISRGEARPS